MWCLACVFNVAAAALSLIGGAMGSAGLWIAPDPTALTKLAAVAATVATIGAALWFISALIDFINCREKHGATSEELKELKSDLKALQDRIEKLKAQDAAPAPAH